MVKVRAADELKAVELALRSVFGLSDNAEFVLLDSTQASEAAGRLDGAAAAALPRAVAIHPFRVARGAERLAQPVGSAIGRAASEREERPFGRRFDSS